MFSECKCPGSTDPGATSLNRGGRKIGFECERIDRQAWQPVPGASSCGAKKIEGTVGALLLLVVDAHQAILADKLIAKPILANSGAVIEYLKATMAHLVFEQVRVLFLGLSNKLIADKIVSIGTIDEAPIYPREIVKHALDLGATGLIIAHKVESMIGRLKDWRPSTRATTGAHAPSCPPLPSP